MRSRYILILFIGIVVVSGCVDEEEPVTTTSTLFTTTSTTPRPIDVICLSELDESRNDETFDCSGNDLHGADALVYPSFMLTREYNLTELESNAREKGYQIGSWYYGPLTIIRPVSENETYHMTVKEADEGHKVAVYQLGECCLDREYIRNKIREMLDDLDLEYSGLNESRIERTYVAGPGAATGPETTVTIPTISPFPKNVSFETLQKYRNCNPDLNAGYVIKSQEDLRDVWDIDYHGDLPNIDFSQNTVLGVFFGELINGGGITITNIIEKKDRIIVLYDKDYTTGRLLIFYNPCHIVKIKSPSKSIFFIEYKKYCKSDEECGRGLREDRPFNRSELCHPTDCVNEELFQERLSRYTWSYGDKSNCDESCYPCPVCRCINNVCTVSNWTTSSILPTPKTPYIVEELESITNITSTFKDEDAELSDKILRDMFDKINPLVQSFTGEKYVNFNPRLDIAGASEKEFNWNFIGRGYVDERNYDDYNIRGTRALSWIDFIVRLTRTTIKREGVPEEYKNRTLEIIKRKSKVLDECPRIGFPIIGSVKWNPEKQGYTLSGAGFPSMGEGSYSLILVNLRNASLTETECTTKEKPIEISKLFEDTKRYYYS